MNTFTSSAYALNIGIKRAVEPFGWHGVIHGVAWGVALGFTDDFGGDTCDRNVRRHILKDNGASTDLGALADFDIAENFCACCDACRCLAISAANPSSSIVIPLSRAISAVKSAGKP